MLLILSSSVLATSFLSGVVGMAGGMVLMGILLLFMSVQKAMLVHGVSQFTSNGWRAVMWRRQIDWPVLRGYALGAALAVGVLVALHATISRSAVMVMLGITPFLGYLLPPGMHLDVQRRGHSFACGVVCMGMQMLSGVSGPLLDAFFVRSAMSRHQVVATKAAAQTLSHATRIAFFGTLLVTSNETLGPGLIALVMVSAIVGTSASKLVLDRMTDVTFRQVTQRLVLALGAFYLAAGLWDVAQG